MLDAKDKIEGAAAAAAAATVGQPPEARLDAVEHAMTEALDAVTVPSVLYISGEEDPTAPRATAQPPGHYFLMEDDPRLPKMPDAPTLLDFFNLRLRPSTHLLQSATLALKAGHSEKIVLACLLHDFSVLGFIRADHGYWAAQMFEPYVDEEVAWGIRYHQALRFFADEPAGYAYPEMYIRFFGENFRRGPHIQRDYEYARNHKWYMTGRAITINDIYAFDPNMVVNMDDFVDIIGRNFKQPKEGLGNDNSSSAHMWRTMRAPTRFL